MKDLMLNPVSHDLVMSEYDLLLVSDLDQITQNIKIRLLFLYSEWFLNINKGVPYIEQIGVKNPNIALIDSLLKATIAETTGVTQIISYSSSYSATLRTFDINFIVETEFGESIIQNITLG
jgi:hypothetical protein